MTDIETFGLCEHCVSGYVIPGTPKGTEEKIGPLNTYVARPEAPASGKEGIALVFFCDVFGLGLVNNKILADRYAEKLGIPVFVPDYFHGKPITPSFGDALPSTAAEAKGQGLMSKISMVGKMFTVGPWFVSNRPATKYAEVDQFLKVLREEKGYKKLGATGYCYGGHFSMHTRFDDVFSARVANHPSLWQMEWVEKVNAPISFAFTEVDTQVSDAQREKIESILKGRTSLASECKTWPGTTHGNFARPNLADPQVKAGFEGAFAQGVNWFQKHLVGSTSVAEAPAAAANL